MKGKKFHTKMVWDLVSHWSAILHQNGVLHQFGATIGDALRKRFFWKRDKFKEKRREKGKEGKA